MRRFIAIALSLLLALQWTAAPAAGLARVGCTCCGAPTAVDAPFPAAPHCLAEDRAGPDRGGDFEGIVGGSGDPACPCCDGACAYCFAQVPPALPSAIVHTDAQPSRQPPAALMLPATAEHVPAVPLRPPSDTRR